MKKDGIINSTICEQVKVIVLIVSFNVCNDICCCFVVVVVVVYHSFINYGFLFSYTHITLQEPFGPDTPL